jgi:class 3 adenylate cyclase/tetratricopeptide (TPR) repeat protein
MNCPRCHHENRSGARFCEECATPLARACANCGAQLSAAAKFCSECAHPAGPVGPPVPQRFVAPETYTPKHLAERIINSKAALEGERKQVTVLFADLKGSMELFADRDPEEARKILDPVLELMMEAVHRFEGTVNQVMGDGIMALFGAPVAHEDHAVRACYAALMMQESVAQYAEAIFRSHGVPIQIRVGLNSGEVVVRAIGSDLHIDYTAVGQTTHLAARMEQMATPGTILLTPATLQLAEGYFEVAARGPVAVKGLAEPVEVYALTEASAQRPRLHAATTRGLTRFVGRDAEIEQMRRAFDLAHDGHGQLVAIVGEPGVGKSRLVYEFTHSHRTQDWLILEAGSVSFGKATSYLPVIDLLKAYFKVHDRETHREIREKVTGKVLTLDRTLEPIVPALLALLDVPVEDTHWQALDPAQRGQRTLEAVKHLLLRESQGQPVLVVFEDLHWIDGATQSLLDSVVESLPAARLLLLVNYRPEYQHAWGSKTYYRQLSVDPLPPESADELLAALLGSDVALGPVRQLLVERTEANPLFLEESVRALVETAALTGERGAYRLTRPVEHLTIPPTVQAILAARIDRLMPEAKRLLQAAAVIGKDVPMPLLLAIAEAPEYEVRAELTRLQAAEFLYETQLFPDLEYTFKHALTHEVAYKGLLHDRQRVLHARITEAVERLWTERLAEQAEQLAHHALRGELWSKAVSYSRQSAAKAVSRAANREAVACLEHALTALDCLPDDRDRQQQAVDIRLELAIPLFGLADLRRRSRYLREAEQLVGPLQDQSRACRAWTRLAHQLWIEGDPEAALGIARSAVTSADAVATPELRIAANLVLGQIHHVRGDLAGAITVLLSNLDVLEGYSSGHYPAMGTFLNPVPTHTWLAWAHADLGAFSEGDAFAREAVRHAEIGKQSYALVHAYFARGLCHLLRGDIQDALPVLEGGLRLSRDADIPISFCLIAPVAGTVYTLSGRSEDGIALLRKAFEDTASYGVGHYQARRLTFLGEAYLLAGRVAEATSTADRALESAQWHKEPGNEAWARRLLGDIALHRAARDIEASEAHHRKAMTMAEGLGMRPLVAHCHLGLGKLCRRTDEHERAQEHLAAATTMYRDMGMTYWLEKAEAATRELG